METRFGFVSTYSPTHCGIATFTASLVGALQDSYSQDISVIRLVDSDNRETFTANPPEIATVIRAGDPDSMSLAIDYLNSLDVAIIQHEFGIYGGQDGKEILDLLYELRIPTIVVLHTVLANPTKHQRSVFVEICSLAGAVVTMSKSAREQLVSQYFVDSRKIYAIPHGARPISPAVPVSNAHFPLILTWGLIGPGKGIEWAIEAMHKIRDMECSPRYIVAGRTHPKVLEKYGETYREGLQKRIDALDLSEYVRLEGEYMSSAALDQLIASATVVLLPYDSTDQTTSGVLIEAVAASRPVVATGFPHAKELLSSGAGIIVAHRDPIAMADALRKILEDSKLATSMSHQAKIIAAELPWSAVARNYVRLANILIHSKVVAWQAH